MKTTLLLASYVGICIWRRRWLLYFVSLNSFKGSFKLIILLELSISERKEEVFESCSCHLFQPSALHQLLFRILCNSRDRIISPSREMSAPHRFYFVFC